MSEIERPKVLVAIINLYVFNTGEVGMKYENLGPTQFVKIMLKVVSEFVVDRFDPNHIVSNAVVPTTDIIPEEPSDNGGHPI